MLYLSFAFERLPWRGVLEFHKTKTTVRSSERVCSNFPMQKSLSSVVQANMRYSSTLSYLRPYQKECIDTCLSKFFDHKVNRQIVSLPVGKSDKWIYILRVSLYKWYQFMLIRRIYIIGSGKTVIDIYDESWSCVNIERINSRFLVSYVSIGHLFKSN